jgi:predicted acyltransferase
MPLRAGGDPGSETVSAPKYSSRLVSIDVLRGLTVALMILVNTAGDGSVSYAQLRHSIWNGCTLTDLVFPMFLFIMGVSMFISFRGRSIRKTPRSRITLQALKRSTIIVGLGLFLNAFPYFHLASLRYCGVMQRIGICYLLASLLLLFLNVAGVAAFTVAALIGYWLLMAFFPVPGFGRSGLSFGMLNPVANLASAIDRALIPQVHLYHQSFYDPEGILSTLPAVGTVLLGVLAGWALLTLDPVRRLRLLMTSAGVLLAIACLWNEVFPFNKRLWTSSYVLLCAGISILLLALLSWLLDGREKPLPQAALTPWLAFGSNALVAYMLSELLAIAIANIPFPGDTNLQQFTYHLIPALAGPPALRSFEWSVLFTVACFVPVLALYRRKIFIKL